MMFGLGVSVTAALAFPFDRQHDVRERRVDGCVRLVNGDPSPFNTIVQEADVRDPLGEGLDQVDRILLHGGFHRGHETSVVDRVLQVVAGGSGGGVDAEHEVDDEDLALALLELEHPVVAVALDAQHRELVGHASSPVGWPVTCPRTLSASWAARTSCTRRPHTPCWASSTVSAVLACSRSPTGRGVPPEARSLPRKDLRLAPTSNGYPRSCSGARSRTSSQLCSGRFANPSPGSSTRRSGVMPAASAASARAASSSRTAATTPPGPS